MGGWRERPASMEVAFRSWLMARAAPGVVGDVLPGKLGSNWGLLLLGSGME